MEREGEIELPPLRWQRELSLIRRVWYVRSGASILAIVDEAGRFLRKWIFYLLEGDHWIELIAFGSHGPPVEGISPQFGSILEYAAPVVEAYTCLLLVEREHGSIWWLMYYRISVGVYFLMFSFQSRLDVVEIERVDLSSEQEEDSDSDSSEFVQLVFDI
jgi:hypothetical protein